MTGPEAFSGVPRAETERETTPETKRHFTVLPGEVPEAPDGGDFVLDQSSDPAIPGSFEYAGFRLRPPTPEEYTEITTITADPILRRERGPRRLSILITTPPETTPSEPPAPGEPRPPEPPRPP